MACQIAADILQVGKSFASVGKCGLAPAGRRVLWANDSPLTLHQERLGHADAWRKALSGGLL